MCMYDDGDGWAVYNQSNPKARKATRCDECGRDILPGEKYQRIEGRINGNSGWDTFRMCEHCRSAAEWLVKVCDGYPLGSVLADLNEHALDYDDEWLKQQVANMRNQWRYGQELMPLPVLPDDLSKFGARH